MNAAHISDRMSVKGTHCVEKLRQLHNGVCALRGFPPIATKRLGITTNLGAMGGFYGTETVIRL